MQERIAEYVAMLKAKGIKSIPDYETPARECASYFDGRGIDMPNANDWEAFKEYFTEKFKQERGRDISPTTLQQNYVARGKAFYRWCASQDGSQETAPLFAEDKTEAINPREPEAEKPLLTEGSRPPAPDEEASAITENAANNPERKEAEPKETDKPAENVRVNFLLSKEHHEALMSLALLEQKTLTDILTKAVKAHIEANSERVKIMREAIKTARSR